MRIDCDFRQCGGFLRLARIFHRKRSRRFFSSAIEGVADLYVPVISIYEVFKKVLRERGENDAIQAASVMRSAT
jgi:predicted nucleic acid-binding protein